MSLTSEDGYLAAPKQLVQWLKTTTRTTIAAMWFSVFDIAGNPGAGTLAGSNTANGVVPTDATTGCPVLNAFSGSNKGYVTNIEFGNTVASRLRLFDMVFKAGAYSFNANTTLSAQPSYAGRMPNGDYRGTEIWVEFVTASTGTQSVAVTYTNQDGTTARTTGTVVTVAGTVGRLFQLPLQAGDTGVQKIESVVGSVASAGTFNILVLRPLWTGRVKAANDGDKHNLYDTGCPEVFADSALFVAIAADSTSSGIPEMQIEVANA